MGLEALEIVTSLISKIGTLNLSGALALVGLALIGVTVLAYIIYGLIKLGKWVTSLRAKEFSLFLLGVGVVLVVAALILP
ncbi:MAG: hypothetical protein B7O98_05405 [Zestosphaera tikiterensis]|uniref:Uncharacterized protein n=1 Tax=Zestosphaera tikiterensis TaxID=1973259 RepID=A0A2R7Y5Q1_9CREN|nr:MAG: hypothetical protein B7O98_05405 [Zestosphaera tikiterensis]